MVDREATSQHWCILRTSGARTLKLAESLRSRGIEAWTPRRTFKRIRPGKQKDLNGKRLTIEVDAPILPTFVFARASRLIELESLAVDQTSPHPAFSIFCYAGRAPLVRDRDVTGLQEAEQAAAITIQALRDAETREEADRVRIDALKTRQAQMRAVKAAQHEHRKLLRSERRDFTVGEVVRVEEMPSLTGMTGIVVSSDGRGAFVNFGGALTMKIEAWQLSRALVQDVNIAA